MGERLLEDLESPQYNIQKRILMEWTRAEGELGSIRASRRGISSPSQLNAQRQHSMTIAAEEQIR